MVRTKRIVLAVFVLAIVVSAVGGFAQTGYGSVTPSIPACSATGSPVQELSESEAAAFVANLTQPAGVTLVTVYFTQCFGNVTRTLSSFDDALTCDNAVLYKVDSNGNLSLWPFSCNDDSDSFSFNGTGAAGHIIVYALDDDDATPAQVIFFGNTL